MKRLTTLMVVLMIAVTMFVACGQSQEPEQKENQPKTTAAADANDKAAQTDTSKSEDKTITSNEPVKSEDTTKVPSATEDKPAQTTKTVDETKSSQTEQKNDQTAKTDEKPPFYNDFFDGQYVKCKLPDKWTGQEDLNQGVAAAIIDPTLKAGISIQIVRNNKDTLKDRVDATAKALNGKIDSYSAGKYTYSRITATVQGKNVIYLLCVVGSNAYYIATDILDDPGIATILGTLELK